MMNKITCSNCGFQNEAGLSFCVNCGTALVNQNAPKSNPNSFGANQPQNVGIPQQFGAQTNAKPSGTGRNLAIFGGLGCLALIVGGVVLLGFLFYIGKNVDKNANDDQAVNRNIVASNSKTFVNSNSSSPSNSNSAKSGADSDFDIKMMPSQIGNFEVQGDSVEGDPTKDFPGADKIYKVNYLSGTKKVNVVVAKFSSHEAARDSFGYFINGFKSAGAKILGRQKGKDKKGGDTEFALYTYKSGSATVYETMLYSEIYGFRFTAPDRETMKTFLQDFAKYGNAIG